MFLARRCVTSARRRLVVLACVVPVALAACSSGEEDPEPIIRSDESASASASPSPSAAPSKQPWEKRTKAGAVAFVKHWVDVFNQAGASGDTGELREISAEGCRSCTNFADFIERVYSAGGFYDSSGWRIGQAGLAESSTKTKAQVVIRVNAGAERYRESSDAREEQKPASEATYSAIAEWRTGGWVLSRLDFVS